MPAVGHGEHVGVDVEGVGVAGDIGGKPKDVLDVRVTKRLLVVPADVVQADSRLRSVSQGVQMDLCSAPVGVGLVQQVDAQIGRPRAGRAEQGGQERKRSYQYNQSSHLQICCSSSANLLRMATKWPLSIT